jgi:hypothetical protein
MESQMVRFSKLILGPDGRAVETNIRTIKRSAIGKCPHCILVAEHYRNDGSCKCDDPGEAVMAEWGYHWTGKQWEGIEEN